MVKSQKHASKTKPSRAQGSRSPADKDFTCSELQLDNLLSEGESTGPSGKAKDASPVASIHRRKSP